MNNVEVIHLRSVENERLKFRVIVGLNGTQYAVAGRDAGEYEFNLPPITNYNNNRKYDNCLITMDGFIATPGFGVNDPVWNVNSPAVGGNVIGKLGAVVIELNVPSAQTQQVAVALAANVVSGGEAASGSGFKQFAQMRKVEVGDNTGAVGPAVNMYAWEWTGQRQEPVLCANPFGSQVKLTISTPAVDASTCWIQSAAAGAGGADNAEYAAAFTIEMVPSTNINSA